LVLTQLSESYDTLLILGFSSIISSGSTFTFSLTNDRFINPPSTAPVKEFYASSLNAQKLVIDSTGVPASY